MPYAAEELERFRHFMCRAATDEGLMAFDQDMILTMPAWDGTNLFGKLIDLAGGDPVSIENHDSSEVAVLSIESCKRPQSDLAHRLKQRPLTAGRDIFAQGKHDEFDSEIGR
jgi:hypothetical protein